MAADFNDLIMKCTMVLPTNQPNVGLLPNKSGRTMVLVLISVLTTPFNTLGCRLNLLEVRKTTCAQAA